MPKHPPSRLAPCIWPDVLVLASAPFTPTAPINPHSSSLLIRRGLVHRAVSPPRRLNYLLSQHLPASLTKPIAVLIVPAKSTDSNQSVRARCHRHMTMHPCGIFV